MSRGSPTFLVHINALYTDPVAGLVDVLLAAVIMNTVTDLNHIYVFPASFSLCTVRDAGRASVERGRKDE